MDSKERDERAKKGFGERGEKLYKPKKKRNIFKKIYKYDMFDKTTAEILKTLLNK